MYGKINFITRLKYVLIAILLFIVGLIIILTFFLMITIPFAWEPGHGKEYSSIWQLEGGLRANLVHLYIGLNRDKYKVDLLHWGSVMRLKIVIALIAIIVLYNPVFGQTTAEDWFNSGVALKEQLKYNTAIQAFDKAIELDPQYADAWSNKGVVLIAQGKFNEAVKAYDKAIELDPKSANSWTGKGNALEAQAKYDEALEAYEKAIEIDSQLTEAWFGKGNALYNQGKVKEASQAYDRAIELDPCDCLRL